MEEQMFLMIVSSLCVLCAIFIMCLLFVGKMADHRMESLFIDSRDNAQEVLSLISVHGLQREDCVYGHPCTLHPQKNPMLGVGGVTGHWQTNSHP
jgi:hypothetical protein